MAIDDHDDPKTEAAATQDEPNAIRNAFLARRPQDGGAGGGDAGDAAVSAAVRGSYVTRLTAPAPGRRVAVVGAEETGGEVVRGIYAARAAAVATAGGGRARPARKAKKAAPARKAKKAAPKRRAAAKAAARKAPARRAKKAAPRRAKKTAAPARRAKKAAPRAKKAAPRAKKAAPRAKKKAASKRGRRR